jgi:acetoacetate decarboxylase
MKNLLTMFIVCLTTSFSSQSFGQSMPQIFGKPPINYSGSDVLAITFKTTPKVIKQLVPKPMVAVDSQLITINMAFHRVPDRQDYYEMFISIPVTVNGKKGNYHPLLYLDKTAPTVAGREVWGFPKIDGSFKLEKKIDKIHFSLSRNGTNLLEFSSSLSEPISDVFETEIIEGFVIKEIPSVDGSDTPDLHRLNSYISRNTKVYEIQLANNIDFQLSESEKDFFPNIPVVDIIDAKLFKLDFILDYGEIEYDYLKEK